MPDNHQSPLSPRDICRILFRHKGKAALVFCTTTAVVVLVIVFAPRTYSSKAKLFIRVGRENVTLDPTATTGQVLPMETKHESQIISMLELLGSRIMLEKVVDIVGADKVLGRSEETGQGLVALPRLIPVLDPVSDREKAVRRLEKTVEAWTEESSDVVMIEGKAKRPGLAQEIVQTLVEVYLEEHVRMNRTPGSHAFFAEQSALLAEQLGRAREALRELKDEIGVLSIDSQQEILQDRVVTVETELIRTEAKAAAADAQIAALKEKLAALPEKIILSEVNGLPNVAADNMHKQLYDLQIQEAELSTKFVDGYAPLEAVRQQTHLAGAILERQQPSRIQWTSAVNPIHQELYQGLLSEEANAESLRAEAASLRGQYARVQAEIRSLNARESQVAQLQREVDLLEANCRDYAEKVEQSRINEALENERISNVNVVQPASFVGRPISPRKGMVLALGLVFATAGALAVVALAECLDRSLKTPAEVEGRLDLPVLLSIPRLPRRRVVLNY